ncbi:MAG: MFS transporter [Herpetosiphonaceae bacterium]|nr:MFS transporter [Herpetosiphonaceae bacterium]
MRIFLTVWVGQLVSLVGSGMTRFGLAVWVYERTGSVTQLSLIALFATLPALLLSPIAGALVDRWDRRWAMILSDSGAGFCSLAIALLLFMGWLNVWSIYLLVGISAAFSAFQWPAYSAATTLLVPAKQLGRASGLVQLSQAIAQIFAPSLAGVLVVLIKLQSVVLIDVATFIFSLITLLIIRFPRPMTTEQSGGRSSLRKEAVYGWTYITARPGLLALLLFFAGTNFTLGFVPTLLTPLVLSFASPQVLGTVSTIAGLGMLLGSLLMSAWGGPRRRVYGVLLFTLLQGVVLLLGGLQPSTTLVAGAAFLFLFATPFILGSSQAIWQSKVAPDVQGRVFAVRRMIAISATPLAYVLAGPLADRVFEPLLAPHGALAPTLGQLIGVGRGRGIGLMLIGLGILTGLTVLAGFLYPHLRNVEDELPDVVISAQPDPAVSGAVTAAAASSAR